MGLDTSRFTRLQTAINAWKTKVENRRTAAKAKAISSRDAIITYKTEAENKKAEVDTAKTTALSRLTTVNSSTDSTTAATHRADIETQRDLAIAALKAAEEARIKAEAETAIIEKSVTDSDDDADAIAAQTAAETAKQEAEAAAVAAAEAKAAIEAALQAAMKKEAELKAAEEAEAARQAAITAAAATAEAKKTEAMDYTDQAIADLVSSAPGTLDTLNELASALGDDPNFATTVTNNIATKVSKSGDTMTGVLKVDTDQEYDSLAGLAPANFGQLRMSSGNNGMSIGLDDDFNSRIGWIQVGHSSNTYPSSSVNGTLRLNPHGGNVTINNHTAFHNGYHPNADKWTTARNNNINLTGDVTGYGSASVDGTGNWTVTVNTTVGNDSHNHDHSDGAFVVGNNVNATLSVRHIDGKATSSNAADHLYLNHSNGKLVYINGSRAFADNYHPNADKWTTARTLSLSGDASGSVSWDGSANATLSVTVANDSHNHSSSSGDFRVNGNLKLGKAGDNNYISFYGVTGDLPGSYNTTLIGERIYANTESSELLIWKGNDLASTSGPDRIRMVGADITFDTYGSTTSGYYTTIEDAGSATTRRIMTIVGATQKVGIGVTAPSEKLSVAGNISVTGTVDGRDVATDGAKLDGIEAGATADQTAAEILTAIKTVDGSGSGLDADTIDGLHASTFQQTSGQYSASVSSAGWYTIANIGGARSASQIEVYDAGSGRHNHTTIEVMWSYGYGGITVINGGRNGNSTIRHARLLYNGSDQTYGGAKLQIYCESPTWTMYVRNNYSPDRTGWGAINCITPVLEGDVSGWPVYKQTNDICGESPSTHAGIHTTGTLRSDASTYTKIATGNSSARPSTGEAGMIRYNTDKQAVEFWANTATNPDWVAIGVTDGTSEGAAAPSGYYIAQNYPSYSSGTYWIKPAGQTNAFQAYVDMSTDGGGYDFYNCAGCTATSYANQANGCPGGTTWAAPRTANWWTAAWAASGSNSSYFAVISAVYKTGGGGNYTGCIMRSPAHYGSGCNDWRVPDGGKWWLRNSTYSEPNGDYTAYGWLQNRNAGQTDAGERTFNDGGAYSTGTNYLCSTNAKP